MEKPLLFETILGTLADFPGKRVDYVSIEWHETRKKLHRKTSRGGADIALRLGDEILKQGLRQDDVLGINGDTIYVVDIPPFEALVIHVDPAHSRTAEKLCWEIGNKHIPLFWGEAPGEFITPYDAPLETLLRKIHGLKLEKLFCKPDFSKAVSASFPAGHEHGHE
jgi:urease accessory protein